MLYGRRHNFLTATERDHWKDLLEVPTKNDGKSTKTFVTIR